MPDQDFFAIDSPIVLGGLPFIVLIGETDGPWRMYRSFYSAEFAIEHIALRLLNIEPTKRYAVVTYRRVGDQDILETQYTHNCPSPVDKDDFDHTLVKYLMEHANET